MVVDLAGERLVDAQRCEENRLLASGYSTEAARRVAAARIPSSLAAGIGAVDFLHFVEAAVACAPPDDAIVPISDAKWLPAIDAPRFRDFMSFEQHHLTARHVLGRPVPAVTYELPTYYKGSSQTLIGDGVEFEYPAYSQWLDFELEMGFVVGRAGADLTPDEAGDCLFGVTLLNDFSARDRQFHETQGNLGPAKGKDFATAVGPWITTVDELDLLNIDLAVYVNGDCWCTATSGSAMWSPCELLAYLSTGEPLIHGELIGSGTVGGGCGLEVGRQLVSGDVVELRSAALGTLTNRVGPPGMLRWSPPARIPGETLDGAGISGLAPALPPRADAPRPPVDRER